MLANGVLLVFFIVLFFIYYLFDRKTLLGHVFSAWQCFVRKEKELKDSGVSVKISCFPQKQEFIYSNYFSETNPHICRIMLIIEIYLVVPLLSESFTYNLYLYLYHYLPSSPK